MRYGLTGFLRSTENRPPVCIERAIVVSILIQVVGVVSSALTNVVVSRRFGPESQGVLASARSWLDLATQVALFGLPQALSYALCSRSVPALQVSSFAACCSLGAIAVGVILDTNLHPLSHARTVAVVGMVIYGLYRPLVLAESSTVAFNVISIVPGVALLSGAAVLRSADVNSLNWLLGLTGACAALSAAAFVRPRWQSARLMLPISEVVKLLKYGCWPVCVSAIGRATIVITYELLRKQPSGTQLVGLFSIPMLLMSTAALPVEMIAPVLLKHWSAELFGVVSDRTLTRVIHRLAMFSVLAGISLGLASIFLVPVVFGADFRAASVACAIFGISAYPLLLGRVLGTAMLAGNLPREYALLATLRAVVTLGLMTAGFQYDLALTAVAWVIGEICFVIGAGKVLSVRIDKNFSETVGLDLTSWRQSARSSYRFVLARR